MRALCGEGILYRSPLRTQFTLGNLRGKENERGVSVNEWYHGNRQASFYERFNSSHRPECLTPDPALAWMNEKGNC